jgi:hypothetical protein
MGSFAGVLAGLGGEIQRENIQKAAVEHEAYQNLAAQYEKMAESATDEFAPELLKAAFAIRSTPPGKKPPKEATDTHALMVRHLGKGIQEGRFDVQSPIEKPPQKESVSTEVNFPGGAEGQGGMPRMETTGPAEYQLPTPPVPTYLNQAMQEGQQNPQSAQPGSDSPPPVSGMPSPGFGTPAPLPMAMPQLPPPPRRQNEFSRDGEQYAYYKNIPNTPEEERQSQVQDLRALVDLARSIDLTTPVQIANFIRNKQVEAAGNGERWASAGGNWIFNVATGDLKRAGTSNVKLAPDEVLINEDTGEKIGQGLPKIPPPPTGAFNNALAAWKNEHPGQEPTSSDIEKIQRNMSASGEPLSQVMVNGVPTWLPRSQAIGKPAVRTVYAADSTPTTGGQQGLSLTAPPTVPQGTQDQLAGIKNAYDQFKTVETMFKDPQYQVQGPALGRVKMYEIDKLGGSGASETEIELANRLSTLLTSQAFQNGGKQLTGTELERFVLNTPSLNDTVQQALTKTKVALEILRNNYNTRRSMLGPRQEGQIPQIEGGGISAPPGKIKVIRKSDGQPGTISESAFDPAKYERQ